MRYQNKILQLKPKYTPSNKPISVTSINVDSSKSIFYTLSDGTSLYISPSPATSPSTSPSPISPTSIPIFLHVLPTTPPEPFTISPNGWLKSSSTSTNLLSALPLEYPQTITSTHFSNSLFFGTSSGFVGKFTSPQVDYFFHVGGEIEALRTYVSDFYSGVQLFLFVLSRTEQREGRLKVFRETLEQVNEVEEIYEVEGVDVGTFRVLTDLNNN